MSTLFVIDIDGTIADAGRRFAEAGPEPSRNDKAVYDVWVRNVQNKRSLAEDQAVPGMVDLVHSLGRGGDIIYLTARGQEFEEVTRSWLVGKGFPLAPLLTRPQDNRQEGADFKEDSIKFLVRLYKSSSVVVLDDDEKGTLEKKCRDNKWTFLKARSGGQL